MITGNSRPQQHSQPTPILPEKSCPFWQKPCSQANYDCCFWITVEALEPGPLVGIGKKVHKSLCLLFAIFHAANAPKIIMQGPPPPSMPGGG